MSARRNLSQQDRAYRRRGAVAATVAVSLTVMVGFTALAVDVGMMYSTRAELQRTADAAALAAADRLADYSGGDPALAARTAAAQAAHDNQVFGEPVILSSDDVTFGRGEYNPTSGKYAFTQTSEMPNAVRVRVRRTEGSPSGPVPLFFARIFGRESTDIAAQATAVLLPRDIVLVADLSGSHTDDSELGSYKKTNINLYDVWDGLPTDSNLNPKTDGFGFRSEVGVAYNSDGTATVTVGLTSDAANNTPALSNVTFTLPPGAQALAYETAGCQGGQYNVQSGWNPSAGVNGLKFEYSGAANGQLGEDGAVGTHTFQFTIDSSYLADMTVATKAGNGADKTVSYSLAPGPTFGRMDHYGTMTLDSAYSPAADDGLLSLPYNTNWSNTALKTALTQQGYTTAEVNALMSKAYDGSGSWHPRVAAALGLAVWRSGMPGGLWSKLGLPAGNNNTQVSWDTELTWVEPYPYPGGSWRDYFDYMKSSSAMTSANAAFKSRFGVKTWVNYLLEQHPEQAATPGLAQAPAQPMQAVKDAAKAMVDIIEELDSNDQVSLVGYGTYGYGPSDKPNDLSWLTADYADVREKIGHLQAGMWTTYTNIAQGIDEGSAVVRDTAHKSRGGAAKVMVLLTDGNANRTRGNAAYDEDQAKEDTEDAAADARAAGVQIYTVSVGVSADRELMESVATIGKGETFHAEGSIEEYEAQLRAIFEKLGGKRPVILIE